jgi:glycosyltransferase involved in cell wall biosynthesis
MTTPRVGIAMAVYKPEVAQFREQLESITRQTYLNWFCVLTLDSPLEELKKEKGLASFFNDSRFSWNENSQRLGFKNNFNHAISLALDQGAEMIACSDQDDVWYPEKLTKCVESLKAKGPLSLVHSDMDLLVQGKKLSQSAWEAERRRVDNATPASLILRNVVTGASVLMDAKLAKKYPVIPAEIDFHDYWYALVASFHGGVHPIHERLYSYRQHDLNVVGVVAYEGVLGSEPLSMWFKMPALAAKGWKKRQPLIRKMIDLEIPMGFWIKTLFYYRYDLGLGLFVYGLISLFKDRPLARACFIRSVGKFFSFWGLAS